MIALFIQGGPIMWPLLALSVVAMMVTVERLVFMVSEKRTRDPESVAMMLTLVEKKSYHEAIELGVSSRDVVAKVVLAGLQQSNGLMASAIMMAANRELKRYSRGITILDTIITLAPLLGLFGTVTGMIHAFGLLGNTGLSAPTVITGGIAEALIATAFGLVIAMVALLPFNYLNGEIDDIRHDMEQAATQLEVMTHSS